MKTKDKFIVPNSDSKIIHKLKNQEHIINNDKQQHNPTHNKLKKIIKIKENRNIKLIQNKSNYKDNKSKTIGKSKLSFKVPKVYIENEDVEKRKMKENDKISNFSFTSDETSESVNKKKGKYRNIIKELSFCESNSDLDISINNDVKEISYNYNLQFNEL